MGMREIGSQRPNYQHDKIYELYAVVQQNAQYETLLCKRTKCSFVTNDYKTVYQ